MKILLTGGGGFLGEAMVKVLSESHSLTVLDPIVGEPMPGVTWLRASVTDYKDLEKNLAGHDALVIAHMAPRNPDAYQNPELSFQINVTGTANLLHAAKQLGIKNIVLISSASAVDGHATSEALAPSTLPKAKDDLYSLTKALQETLAEHWARVGGLNITQLRIGYVVDGQKKMDKYGKSVSGGGGQTDRFDIARAVSFSLEKPSRGLRTYFVVCGQQPHTRYVNNPIREELGWQPQYPFGV